MEQLLKELSGKTKRMYSSEARKDIAYRERIINHLDNDEDDASKRFVAKSKDKLRRRNRGLHSVLRSIQKEETMYNRILIEAAASRNILDFKEYIQEALKSRAAAIVTESTDDEDDYFPEDDSIDIDDEEFGLTEEELEFIAETITEEEFDQLDELSKKTLTNYTKKSTKAADKAWDKTSAEEDKAMSTDGNKYPEKQERHNKLANQHLDVWRKRDAGISLAKKKLAKEDVGLEEGRGAKGKLRHQVDDNEWGDDEGPAKMAKKKFTYNTFRKKSEQAKNDIDEGFED